MEANEQNLAKGTEIIGEFVKTLPLSSGVYRMLDKSRNTLYVGKAKKLKKRVVNYTHTNKLPVRLQRMVAETDSMEFITTQTESQALLLEADLIKKFKPKYNILLRDDKSFPYISITRDQDFPKINKNRGILKHKSDSFGPFASAAAVNNTIATLQKVFMLRNCSDSVFMHRSRPCLQYQINRCTAPCVGLADKESYKKQVDMAYDFLSGKNIKIQKMLAKDMQEASDKLEFELAASYRDRIQALSHIQGKAQTVSKSIDDADVIAIRQERKITCIQIFFYRGGQSFGNHAFFPRHDPLDTETDVLEAFISQFYANRPVPKQILLNIDIQNLSLISKALSQKENQKIKIYIPKRGSKRALIKHALDNAKATLAKHLSSNTEQTILLTRLAKTLKLDAPPKRIEVYDNSHISGQHPIGAMIVSTPDGFAKSAYRKFNIKHADVTEDDYAMMDEVLTRRFKRALKEDPDRTKLHWPDLVLIDGGQGQLNTVMNVFEDLGIRDIPIVAIAKGPDRNAGREKFFIPNSVVFQLPEDDPVLYYLQRLRDEAHRFAIGSHRAQRKKKSFLSPLDGITGIGPNRKKSLLHYFGSAKAIAGAGLPELENVEGISKSTAKKVYDHFHDSE